MVNVRLIRFCRISFFDGHAQVLRKNLRLRMETKTTKMVSLMTVHRDVSNTCSDVNEVDVDMPLSVEAAGSSGSKRSHDALGKVINQVPQQH